MVTKMCKQCNLEKDTLDFRHQNRGDKVYTSALCKKCDRKERDKRYYNRNKKKVRQVQQHYLKKRYHNDPNFRIRKTISKAISRALKLNGSVKGTQSCLYFLPYSIQELREYLEKHFEPWMNWDNYGIYNPKTWDDNDQSTWTWQIDHIVPQSNISYTSMGSDNFRRCWSLENVRPLAAKQNWLDGVNRTRHGGSTW